MSGLCLGVTHDVATVWWDLKIPLKIKTFMWLVGKHKILTEDNLAKKWLECHYSLLLLC
jgi:zinc-binding in reverse transcriptase